MYNINHQIQKLINNSTKSNTQTLFVEEDDEDCLPSASVFVCLPPPRLLVAVAFVHLLLLILYLLQSRASFDRRF